MGMGKVIIHNQFTVNLSLSSVWSTSSGSEVNPHLWPGGPRILDGVGPIRLQLVAATPYRSGVVWLRYRPAGA